MISNYSNPVFTIVISRASDVSVICLKVDTPNGPDTGLATVPNSYADGLLFGDIIPISKLPKELKPVGLTLNTHLYFVGTLSNFREAFFNEEPPSDRVVLDNYDKAYSLVSIALRPLDAVITSSSDSLKQMIYAFIDDYDSDKISFAAVHPKTFWDAKLAGRDFSFHVQDAYDFSYFSSKSNASKEQSAVVARLFFACFLVTLYKLFEPGFNKHYSEHTDVIFPTFAKVLFPASDSNPYLEIYNNYIKALVDFDLHSIGYK